MKLLLALVLILAVCGFATAQETSGGYTAIPWDPTNEDLVNLLNFGLQYAIPNAKAAGQISDGNWDMTKVNSVEDQIVAGMNYQFSVEISDGAGNIAILTFVVYEDLLGYMNFVNSAVL